MKVQTKYFGEIEYDADDCFSFPNGLYGFEDESEFILLPFEGSQSTLLCLQSTKTPGLAFILMDPFSFMPDYAPALQAPELENFGVKDSGELCYYVMCVVRKPISDSTVNLKCPIVIHPSTRISAQIILDTTLYEMRHPLSQFHTGEEETTC
ncbi:MAG: flagellar assembly protein FliW [Oscillospiraceae bacterium]|nr:flagellar assembly protein FliW [Oscillospiraceae bacterium]